MKNIRIFLSENIHILVVKFSVYLNRHVFVMNRRFRSATASAITSKAQIGKKVFHVSICFCSMSAGYVLFPLG